MTLGRQNGIFQSTEKENKFDKYTSWQNKMPTKLTQDTLITFLENHLRVMPNKKDTVLSEGILNSKNIQREKCLT